MKNQRLKYFILICITIIAGLTSRKISSIPLVVGDGIWVIMIFFLIQFLFIDIDIKTLFTSSLAVCYIVEFSQLYQSEWINKIRKTLFGRLVLGSVFSWGDIAAYTIGIIIVTAIKIITTRQLKSSRE